MNSHLRLFIGAFFPWITINKTINDQYCNGILCDLLKYVSKSLNFTYEYISLKQVVGDQVKSKTLPEFFASILNNVSVLSFSLTHHNLIVCLTSTLKISAHNYVNFISFD